MLLITRARACCNEASGICNSLSPPVAADHSEKKSSGCAEAQVGSRRATNLNPAAEAGLPEHVAGQAQASQQVAGQLRLC